MADYLLYYLNKIGSLSYSSLFGTNGRVESTHHLLETIARNIGARGKEGAWNKELAARHFLKCFRGGQLGKFTLDTVEEEIEFQRLQEERKKLQLQEGTPKKRSKK